METDNLNAGILSKNEIEQTLRNQEDTLREYSVKWLGLFGSYGKGAARDDSDIDLLVEFEKLSFDNYMGLRIFL